MDIAYIIIACTLVNHLGLVQAVENKVHHDLPIVNCPKCLTFWSVLAYGTIYGDGMLWCVAISFLSALAAVWLDLMLSVADFIYLMIYETFNIEGTGLSETAPKNDTGKDDEHNAMS